MASMQMTKTWWVANVSGKVLQTRVADALADWAKWCKKSPQDFGSRKEFDNARATCIELTKELEKAHSLCGVLQKETKKVIAEMLLTVDKYHKVLDGVQKAKDAEWDVIKKPEHYINNQKIGKVFRDFAEKEKSTENIDVYGLFKNGRIKSAKDMEIIVEKYILKDGLNVESKHIKKAKELYGIVRKEKDPIHYADMDWSAIFLAVMLNLSDTIKRFVEKYDDTYYALL